MRTFQLVAKVPATDINQLIDLTSRFNAGAYRGHRPETLWCQSVSYRDERAVFIFEERVRAAIHGVNVYDTADFYSLPDGDWSEVKPNESRN